MGESLTFGYCFPRGPVSPRAPDYSLDPGFGASPWLVDCVHRGPYMITEDAIYTIFGIDPDLDPEAWSDGDLDPESVWMPEYERDLQEIRSVQFISSLGPNIQQYQQWLSPDGLHSIATRPELQAASQGAGLSPIALEMLQSWMFDPDFGASALTARTQQRLLTPMIAVAAAALVGGILLRRRR